MELLFFDDRGFSFFSSGFSTSLYVVEGRGIVSLAFWRADLNSCFSEKVEYSTQYSVSSFLSPEMLMDPTSGRSSDFGMV